MLKYIIEKLERADVAQLECSNNKYYALLLDIYRYRL